MVVSAQPGAFDQKYLRSLVKRLESLAYESPYVGVSWRDLARYDRYEEPGSGIILTKEDMCLTQLYAGVAVICVDLHHHFFASGPGTAGLFEDVFSEVATEERGRYGREAFPYDDENFPHKDELPKLPEGWTTQATPVVVMKYLEDPRIRHEWTVKPGKRFYSHFLQKASPIFNRMICGKGGLCERSEAQESEIEIAKELVLLIVAALGHHQPYVPLGAAMAVIMVKRKLRVYCDTR